MTFLYVALHHLVSKVYNNVHVPLMSAGGHKCSGPHHVVIFCTEIVREGAEPLQ